ncbi:hypothetical protein [Halorubrum halophilum]|nr:hypothetical protein [Halorubrum halophilum]
MGHVAFEEAETDEPDDGWARAPRRRGATGSPSSGFDFRTDREE